MCNDESSYYNEIAKKVESGFRIPEFLPQKITYVKRKDSADITISCRHTLGDYLLVGFAALQQSIRNHSGQILVYHDANPSSETIGYAVNPHMPFRTASVNSALFLQLVNIINEIYDELYVEEMKCFGIGLTISMAMNTQFSEIGYGIPEEIISLMKFENFDDLQVAQENALMLLKKMTASSVTGFFYAVAHGEE